MYDTYTDYNGNEYMDQCKFFGEVGRCVTDHMLTDCNIMWPPYVNVTRNAITSWAETMELICTYSSVVQDTRDQCLLAQFDCIDMTPSLDMTASTLYSMVFSDILGMPYLVDFVEDLDFYLLRNAAGQSRGHRAHERIDARYEEESYLCHMFGSYEQACYAQALRENCTWRDPQIGHLIRSMASLLEAECWLFGDPDHYSVDSMVDLAWFSHMTEDNIAHIREMMRAVVPYSTIAPEHVAPEGEHVVTVQILLNIPFNERFSDIDHPQTRRFSAAFQHSLHELLQDHIHRDRLETVIVTEYFRGSLGVQCNLIFQHGMADSIRSVIGLQVASAINRTGRHMEIYDLDYGIGAVNIVVHDHHGELVSIPISLDHPTDICYMYLRLHLCDRGYCEMNSHQDPICRCPDGTSGNRCPEHTVIIEQGSHEESDEHGDDIEDDLGLVMATVVMGVVGVLLVAMGVVITCNIVERKKKEKMSVPRRNMVPLPRNPMQPPAYYPINVPVTQIPLVQPETISWVPNGTVRNPPTYFQNTSYPNTIFPANNGSMRRLSAICDRPAYMEEWKTEPFF